MSTVIPLSKGGLYLRKFAVYKCHINLLIFGTNADMIYFFYARVKMIYSNNSKIGSYGVR